MVFEGKSLAEALGKTLFEESKEEFEKRKKEILEKSQNCKHERIEVVESHNAYQIGVCMECKLLFKRKVK